MPVDSERRSMDWPLPPSLADGLEASFNGNFNTIM